MHAVLSDICVFSLGTQHLYLLLLEEQKLAVVKLVGDFGLIV